MKTLPMVAPLALALLVLTAAPSAAQRTIMAGQTVSGALRSSDPVLSDDSHYHIYHVTAAAGQRYRITLRSDDFDAFLAFGREAGPECVECRSDDDSGGGTDSRLVVTTPEAGVYQIRANSLFGGETGRYTLAVEALGSAPAPNPIRVGQTVRGALDSASPEDDDGSYYHAYVFTGQAGERVRVTLRSEDFDAYLMVGRAEAVFLPLEEDDDGAGGTDSVIEFTLPAAGTYEIRASTFAAGETGSYALMLELLR